MGYYRSSRNLKWEAVVQYKIIVASHSGIEKSTDVDTLIY